MVVVVVARRGKNRAVQFDAAAIPTAPVIKRSISNASTLASKANTGWENDFLRGKIGTCFYPYTVYRRLVHWLFVRLYFIWGKM